MPFTKSYPARAPAGAWMQTGPSAGVPAQHPRSSAPPALTPPRARNRHIALAGACTATSHASHCTQSHHDHHTTMTYSGPIIDPHAEPPRQRRFDVRATARSGASFGSALAIAISWSVHKSVLWAILHGLLSWLYVAYYVLTR